MTDIGFVLTITRYFMQNGKRTDEPVTNESYPVYDILLNNGGDTEDKEGYRYDGIYYYQDIDILTGFKSIVNKMKNLLPIYKVYYTIENNIYRIRLVLDKITIDKTGFDMGDFSIKFTEFCRELESEFIIKSNCYGDYHSANVTFVMDGDKEGSMKKFKEGSDKLDNKEVYRPVVQKVNDFLQPYKRFMNVESGFDVHGSPLKIEMKTGFLKKEIKTYTMYELYYILRKKKIS
jgi:hypothetical protein